jgi:hypothetical protein
MQDKHNKTDSDSYEQIEQIAKQTDKLEGLKREFFLGLCETKAQTRILEILKERK